MPAKPKTSSHQTCQGRDCSSSPAPDQHPEGTWILLDLPLVDLNYTDVEMYLFYYLWFSHLYPTGQCADNLLIIVLQYADNLQSKFIH